MSERQHILTQITRLTSNIETNYPELYRFLDESPMTIPAEAHPHLDKSVLEDYLKYLKELLRHQLETQKIQRNETI